MTDSTRWRRWRIRLWLIASNWTDRRLAAAYDRLVDNESDWSS